jgi:beta-barrel assembly-enhancing protease
MTERQLTRRPTLWIGILLIGAFVTLQSCGPSFNIVSIDDEWQMGQELERDINQQVTLVNDATLQGYVRNMGQAIVRQTAMADRSWRFYIIRDGSINAFNAPGGLVYINSGLIAQAGNASELAGVMAHEIAHGTARHGTQRLSRVYGINIVAAVVLGQDPGLVQQIAAQLVAGGTVAAFSREMEREADRLGVRYMAAAGYNPEGMATMFERLIAQRQRNPGAVERFFSTHPVTEDRIREVRREARSVQRSGLRTDDGQFSSMKTRAARQ